MPRKKKPATIEEAVEQERQRCVLCVDSQMAVVTDRVMRSLLTRIKSLILSGTVSPETPTPPKA